MSKVKGICKWFNASKGYGFANIPGDSRDIFIHYSAIDMDGYKTLKEGADIEFELIEGDKGPQAHKVTATPEG